MSAREQAWAWTARVWGDREGFACLGIGFGPHYQGNGYKHRRFVEDFFVWPDQAGSLVDKAFEYADEADVYVGVLLRNSRSRKKGTALPGRVVWADLDEPRDEDRGFERLLIGPRGLLVNSGNGSHPYLWLPEELEPPEIEELNRHLAHTLGADAGWSETKYLRLPGTLNHKPAALGGLAVSVELVDFERAPRDWTRSELLELLGPPPGPNGSGSDHAVEIAPTMPSRVPAHLLVRLDEEPGDDRSKQSLAFVAACIDAHLTDAETLAVALQHRPTKDKYDDRAATEITRSIKKIRSERSVAPNSRNPSPTVPTVGGFQGAPEGGAGANSRTVGTVREDGTTTHEPSGSVEGGSEPSQPSSTVPPTGADSQAGESSFVDPTVTLSEFVARVDESASEALMTCAQGNAYLRGSLGLLVAKTGDGKTTLAVAFVLHASAGIAFAGFSFPRALRILVIQNEGPREAFRQKLEAAAAGWEHAVHGVRVWDEPASWGSVKVSVPEARERLRRVLELHDVDIVIVDTLTRYGVRGNGTPEETREFIEWLSETGLGRDRGFLLLHHPITRPDASLELIDRIAGAWSPHADAVFYLEKLADHRARLSSPKLRWARRGPSRRATRLRSRDRRIRVPGRADRRGARLPGGNRRRCSKTEPGASSARSPRRMWAASAPTTSS